MCLHSVLNLSLVERVKKVDSQTAIKTKIAPKLRLAKLQFFWVFGYSTLTFMSKWAPRVREQDTPPSTATLSCRATQRRVLSP